MKPPMLLTLSLTIAISLSCHAAPSGSAPVVGPSANADETPAVTSRPNVLWITSEDNGPHLGCYGDAYATTPRLDALAARGVIYSRCWSNAPVCAPARTTLISGLYPTSTGSQHLRSMTRLPGGMKMYPQYLRDAGYYCTNNSKEDYNLEKPGKVWDESSRRAHWKNRKDGQPFFAIFNITVSHESQIRRRPHTPVHDPATVRVPAYHPDTPEVRLDWAQYHDKLTEMDTRAGAILDELSAAGLADDTIIFSYADHGSGMPRSKRWPYNSGLHVPLIVVIPEKFAHLRPPGYRAGGTVDRLVGFIDLGPTLLSLAGIRPPAHFQGHAFLGEHLADPPEHLHGFRGRMDERIDMVRSVTDGRYVYIRNYMPHEIYGQHVSYMFQTPTTRVWKQLYDAGKLAPPRTYFWERKPPEELYDLGTDPDEVVNLAKSPKHRDVLERLRSAQREHVLATRDLGFLPEGEIHARAAGSASGTPYEMGHDPKRYPLERILAMAEYASSDEQSTKPLLEGLEDTDSAVRWWAALGLLSRGRDAVSKTRDALRRALLDTSPAVRITAAEALARFGEDADLEPALDQLMELAPVDRNGVYISVLALNALDALDDRARSVRSAIEKLPKQHPSVPGRLRSYVPRLIEKTVADLR